MGVSTLPQIRANRRNSQMSSGPRTTPGKASAASNSLKHGLSSKQALLPTEDPQEFAEFTDRFTEDLKPDGELECFLVERIVGLAWRLQRVARIEAGILTSKYYQILQSQFPGDPARPAVAEQSELATLGDAFYSDSVNADSLSKLSRYETSMARTLERTLHELERLQARRQGERVPVPFAVDINVAGTETR